MYSNPLYRSDPVLRCPNHAAANVDSSLGGGMGAPLSHFVRSDHPSAEYAVGEVTQHHSVMVPYEPAGWLLLFCLFLTDHTAECTGYCHLSASG